MIITYFLFYKMLDAVNEKLPVAERWTLWRLFRTRSWNGQIPFLYNLYYPSGNLAALYWVCLGFSLLSFTGAVFCISIVVRG